MSNTALRHDVQHCSECNIARSAFTHDMPNEAVRNGSHAYLAAETPDLHPPLGYRERPAALTGAVVWTRDIAVDTTTPVLPDGCMDLLLIDDRLVVAGPDTRAHHPTAGPATRVTGIRFFPGIAPALLGVPAHELRDTRAELTDLWSPSRSRRAAELLAAAPTPEAGLEAIARWCATDTDPTNPILLRIVTELRAGTSTSDTAALLDLTPRHLHRLSLAAFGYGPKTLSRILRMQRALTLAREGTPLAETAALTGYADQPHFSRDIRALTGMPLTQLLGQ